MQSIRIILSAVVVLWASDAVCAGPVLTFINDFPGFLQAAGDVREIDFETLPDGTPSVTHTAITPEFNYTDQGVTFSSPFPVLEIGSPLNGHLSLVASHPNTGARNWIIAELVTPATAVGYFFPGGSQLFAYDEQGSLIDSVFFGGSGNGFFLGIVSDIPIGTVVGDRGSSFEVFESLLFTPVPEPVSFVLLAVGAAAVVFCRRW